MISSSHSCVESSLSFTPPATITRPSSRSVAVGKDLGGLMLYPVRENVCVAGIIQYDITSVDHKHSAGGKQQGGAWIDRRNAGRRKRVGFGS